VALEGWMRVLAASKRLPGWGLIDFVWMVDFFLCLVIAVALVGDFERMAVRIPVSAEL